MTDDVELIRDAVIRHWGERCEEYAELCSCCEAWKAFDVITEFMDDGC